MKLVVADAGPLIGMARIGQLDLLKQLYGKILIPTQIFAELKLSSTRPGARIVAQAIETGWIKCITVYNPGKVMKLSRVVDAGEAEAIQLALEHRAAFLLIDDKKGRKAAKSRGVPIIGTGAVLLAAKKAGLLNKVAPLLEALTRAGYRFSPALYARIIQLANE